MKYKQNISLICFLLVISNASFAIAITDTSVILPLFIKTMKYSAEQRTNFTTLILNYSAKPDTIYCQIEVKSNTKWGKEHNAFINKYSGFVVKNQFTLHGRFEMKNWYDINESRWTVQVGNYNDGKIEGQEKYYDETGRLYKKETYKTNKLNGLLINYYPNEQEKDISLYLNDTIDGEYISFYQNGIPKQIDNYSKAKLTGLHKEFYPTGKLKVSGEYSGKFIYAHPSEDPNKPTVFKYNNEEIVDVFHAFSPSFSKIFFETFNSSRFGKTFTYNLKNGEWNYFDEEGKVMKKEIYNIKGDFDSK
jgi:antitoxin component YwqK of YwqJK toxin-antitoxin module